jgi:hypothetical protein
VVVSDMGYLLENECSFFMVYWNHAEGQ